MAPWPEKGNEPKAPDKFGQFRENLPSDALKVNLSLPANVDVNVTASRSDEKQTEEKTSDVSDLDDGQLKALLDEAITYKCPKDREGKSDLFRELLHEVEADESKDEDRHNGTFIRSSDIVGTRYIPGSSRRKNRKDGISERQTKGGSLQNLVHALSSEFDGSTNLGYFTSGYVSGGSRRRMKKNSCNRDSVSVSARQREGGSLPSNVNVGGVGGGMWTLSGFEPAPKSILHSEDPRPCCSKSLVPIKRKDKVLHCSSHALNDNHSAALQKNLSPLGDHVPREVVPKKDLMVIELGDLSNSDERNKCVREQSGVARHHNEMGRVGEVIVNQEKKLSGDTMDDKMCSVDRKSRNDESVVEMESIKNGKNRTQVNYTALATLEVGTSGLQECNGGLINPLNFPFQQKNIFQGDRDERLHYGLAQNSLQLNAPYNSVQCIMGSPSTSALPSTSYAAGPSTSSCDPDQSIKGWEMRASVMYCTGAELYRSTPSGDTSKTAMIHQNVYPTHHLSVLSIPPNHTWITSLGSSGEGRLTFHGSKEVDTKCKSIDENGNATSQVCRLEGTSTNERKSKQRRAKIFNDRNVIMSQNIEGHRGDKDIESLIKFIESDTESKGRPKHTSHNNGTLTLSSKQQRSSTKKDDVGSIKNKRDGVHDDERGCKTRAQGVKNISKDKCSEKNKLKKSNSLEEISKSKIEDLMSFTSAESSAESNVAVSQDSMKKFSHSHLDNDFVTIDDKYDSSRKLHNEDSNLLLTPASASTDEYFSPVKTFSEQKWHRSEEKNKYDSQALHKEESLASIQVEEMEFHVVTKKQRRKKRCSSSGEKSGKSLFDMPKNSGPNYTAHVPKDFLSNQSQKGNGFLPHDHAVNDSGGSTALCQYRHHRSHSPENHRRKSTSSMPQSEKSDSSDLDSVHSLPVSSTTPKLALDKTSTSSGSTPQASYADIARMAATNLVPSTGTSCTSLNNSRLSMSSTKMTGFVCSGVISSPVALPSSQIVSSGPKIRIGTPSVSGTKVLVDGNVIDPLSFPGKTLSFSYCSEADRLGIQQNNTSKKKDAMTNTNIDYKSLSHYNTENSSKSYNSGLHQGSVLNDYYPSLEESLFVDKCDRKSGKVFNTSFPARSLVDNINVPISSLVKKYVDIVCTDQSSLVNLHAINSENSFSTNVIVEDVNSIKKTSKSREMCNFKGKEKKFSKQLSLKLCIQESVFNIKGEAGSKLTSTEDCNFKASNFAHSLKLRNKTKDLSKSKNSQILNYSSERPAVVLMNESLREEVVCDDNDLTFGFEVNEQLLDSIGEDVSENRATPKSRLSLGNRKNETPEDLPRSLFSIQTFLSRFRKPYNQVTDDKIINFIGCAWNDVMKEANSSDGKVQYYNGQ